MRVGSRISTIFIDGIFIAIEGFLGCSTPVFISPLPRHCEPRSKYSNRHIKLFVYMTSDSCFITDHVTDV